MNCLRVNVAFLQTNFKSICNRMLWFAIRDTSEEFFCVTKRVCQTDTPSLVNKHSIKEIKECTQNSLAI